MVRQIPPFMEGRPWRVRASRASVFIPRQVFVFNDDDRYEYERDPRSARGTWHQIDWRQGLYRDIDPETGEPVAGREGQWLSLR